MSRLFSSAFVIARRDFVATVWTRSFIIFLLAPLVLFGFSLLAGQMAGRADRDASQPIVAVAADDATYAAIERARSRFAAGTSEYVFPLLRQVPPTQEREALAAYLEPSEEREPFSAVLSGTLERPVLTGPPTTDISIAPRLALLIEEVRRSAALAQAGADVGAPGISRIVTEDAAGGLRTVRRGLAQLSQLLIFMVTLMLATLLLSNLVEEKSNKVIEVLAAAVPLDAVFIGKLLAMLGISLTGLAVWGGGLAFAWYALQAVPDWLALPAVSPALGWPAFLVLLLLYYTMNYMLLGALFLGIGGQASNIREIQTLSMPVTFLQLGVLLLAMNALDQEGGTMMWVAYVVPFSSPLSMVALAAQSDTWWYHVPALAWQALWVVLIIRVSAGLFRRTVLKSGSGKSFWKALLPRRA